MFIMVLGISMSVSAGFQIYGNYTVADHNGAGGWDTTSHVIYNAAPNNCTGAPFNVTTTARIAKVTLNVSNPNGVTGTTIFFRLHECNSTKMPYWNTYIATSRNNYSSSQIGSAYSDLNFSFDVQPWASNLKTYCLAECFKGSTGAGFVVPVSNSAGTNYRIGYRNNDGNGRMWNLITYYNDFYIKVYYNETNSCIWRGPGNDWRIKINDNCNVSTYNNLGQNKFIINGTTGKLSFNSNATLITKQILLYPTHLLSQFIIQRRPGSLIKPHP
jgi:hypothetical protein